MINHSNALRCDMFVGAKRAEIECVLYCTLPWSAQISSERPLLLLAHFTYLPVCTTPELGPKLGWRSSGQAVPPQPRRVESSAEVSE